MMWSNGLGLGWGMWLAMGLGALTFWVVVAVLVKYLLGGQVLPTSKVADPLGLLEERLARGEITAEEYRTTRRLIANGH